MNDAKPHRKRDIFVEGAIPPSFIGESIAKHASQTAIGGHEIFLGQVRADQIDGRPVEAIEYTAYRDMANEQMTIIREEAFARWPEITCLHVHHSLGSIRAGELCFMVFASAPHRQPAREAVAYVTDEVKKRLPIFGKEILGDGDHHWKANP
ncbi:MAG: molybdenum cofactor biosynthesis protein MoaE [Flavobacteriales bacterium]|nr:molybdenum cofactor biosynthesis protein MoaE [Flavobacteriales bacterium]MBP6698934.1 molybdenum cofactor biosynthesis protein MoaE [Flavobacteriales bacterium]